MATDIHVNGTAGAADLEKRVAFAQDEGLAPNLRRVWQFVGVDGPLELQALGVRDGRYEATRAAHALTIDSAISLCSMADKWNCDGVYVIPAKLRAGVETRYGAPGSWVDLRKGASTSDRDIDCRHVLGVDCDVKRPSGISATDAEMSRSVAVALQARHLLAEIVGESALAYVHSGNGRQIWIALDSIEATDESTKLCASILAGLDALLSTSAVQVDLKLSDPKRLLPACGTHKKKGAAGISERPHRRTVIVTPATVTRVNLDGLRNLRREIHERCESAGKLKMDQAMGIKVAPAPTSKTNIRPGESPFERANAVDATQVAEWLDLYESGQLRCPGCGESKGVDIIDHGLKCLHNRCASLGKQGFRTNVDLVAEVRGVDPREAVNLLADRFGFEGLPSKSAKPSPESWEAGPPAGWDDEPDPANDASAAAHALQSLTDLFAPALERAQRRADQIEKPIPLPWRSTEPQFGGGLWPGMHVVNAGTGTGKTALGLQIGTHAAKLGIPTLYLGLELEELQIALRVLGEEGRAPWSHLYLGKAGPKYIDQAKEAASRLSGIPFFVEFSQPHGWPASAMVQAAEALRAQFPEGEIPGSKPCLVVLDFLQLIGPELGDVRTPELRERIGRAAYTAREIARRLNMVVLVISSISREKLKALGNAAAEAGLTWKADDAGRPLKRGMLNPDALIGIGKESGDIEYAADSVTALVRVPGTYREGSGVDVIVATAKGRATGAGWTPLLFTGFRYEEPEDGGARLVDALNERGASKETKRQVKDDDARIQDEAVVGAVAKEPGITWRTLIERVVARCGCGEFTARKAIDRAAGQLEVRPGPRGSKLYYPKGAA